MSLPQRLWGFDSEFIPSPGTARCEPCRPAREAIAGLVVGLCFVTGLGAQAIREDRTTSANQKANEQVRSTEGAITPAAALVGQKFNDGKFAGQIRKLLFDLDAGRVAFVVVAMGDKAKGESEEIVLPAELFSDLAQLEIKLPADKLESRSPLPAKAEELTRAWAAKIYDQSGLTPYWNQEEAKFNDNDLLISSDRVKNTPVVDDKGKKIAQVQDFAAVSYTHLTLPTIA